MSAAAWYAARAAGTLAYVLLSTSVILGLVLSRRGVKLAWPKFAVEDLHRFLTILTACFLLIHVGGILIDSVVPFSLVNVLVPFTAHYRPLATGLGAVALELLGAVAITNLFRKQLPYRMWRRAHYLTFGVWLAATAHGVLAGTDGADAWFLALYAGAVGGVAATAYLRFASAPVPQA